MRTASYRSRVLILIALISCTDGQSAHEAEPFQPTAVIDLGAVVTEDLPERVWGSAFLEQNGFTDPNRFDVISWVYPAGEGQEVEGSNAYYRIFNHGGPHIDAPNHVGVGGGLDSYPIDAFSGPAKVIDARDFAPGRTIPASAFEGVAAGDVVLLLTDYTPPSGDDIPTVTTVTDEAAEFLSSLPIRAVGTNSFSMEALSDLTKPWVHDFFLGRGIPIYEQLFNVDALLGYDRLFFTGAPLNIRDGDGMIVRPLVFAY